MLKKKSCLIVCIALGLCLLAALAIIIVQGNAPRTAVGGQYASVEGSESWRDGVTELVWFNGGAISGDPATLEGLMSFERNTGIKVKIIEIPGETYAEQLFRTLALGEAQYDVIDASYMLPKWAENGWILPMDDVIPEIQKEQWDPAFKDYISYNGKAYAVPHYNQASVIAVRTDLLQQAGISKLPETWDELLDAARKLTVDQDKNGVPEQYGFVYPASGEEAPWVLKDFVMSSGSKIWNDDGTVGFNNDDGLAAIQFLADLKNKYHVVPDGVVNYKLGDCGDMFNNGQAAMAYLSLGGLIDNARKSPIGENFTIIPIPTRTADIQNQGITQHAYAMVTVVPKNSKHPEAAKRLALWMGTYQQSLFEAVAEGNVPVNLKVFESPYLQKNYAFAEQIQKVLSRSVVVPRYIEEIDVVRKGMQYVLADNQSPKSALEYITNELNKVVK